MEGIGGDAVVVGRQGEEGEDYVSFSGKKTPLRDRTVTTGRGRGVLGAEGGKVVGTREGDTTEPLNDDR